jgi:hypothetical protein
MQRFLSPITIFRVWPLLASKHLLLECREASKQEVKWICLDALSLDIVSEWSIPDWQFSCTGVQGSYALLSRLSDEGPSTEGFKVHHSLTGKLIWESEKGAARVLPDGALAVFGLADSSTEGIYDWEKPKLIQVLSLNELLKRKYKSELPSSDLHLPYLIGEENPLAPQLAQYVHDLLGKESLPQYEYLELGPYVIIGFQENEGKSYLSLSNEEGESIWVEEVSEQTKAGMDTFSVFNNQLIFLKNTQELCLSALVF